MYQIKEENKMYVVYKNDEELARFSTRKEAVAYADQQSKYDLPKEDMENFTIE
ncbi:TPA: hypothetical protein ACWWDF_002821 [Enterococcus faecium]